MLEASIVPAVSLEDEQRFHICVIRSFGYENFTENSLISTAFGEGFGCYCSAGKNSLLTCGR
jgi:hypothetical protein